MLVGNDPEWFDESFSFTDAVRSPRGRLFAALRAEVPECEGRDAWQQAWLEADRAAAAAIGRGLIRSEMFEGRVVTALAGVLPDEASLYVGNSMSLRDVNLYWPPRDKPIDVYSNRGASGIDGLVSSALGVASGTAQPVVLLLGDLSLLHDLSGLLAAVRLQIPLVVVVVNNNGGGIFSFLPFAEMGDDIRFHELFHTPHGSDLGAVVAGIGAAHHLVGSSTELQQAVIGALGASGPTVIEVQVDAAESVILHREIDAAARRALTSGP
jgi:2-succinyl-5-enolpyruvyl-6-hydroxy-3-cyclohexene-1-carboxylate synthase